jgi:hypothetical protein
LGIIYGKLVIFCHLVYFSPQWNRYKIVQKMATLISSSQSACFYLKGYSHETRFSCRTVV